MASLESLAFWSGVAAVVFTALGALAGVASWYTNIQVSQARDERARNLELRLSEQQEMTAKAELTLLELQERSTPRRLDSAAASVLLEFLRIGNHPSPVMIDFVGGSSNEPHDLAEDLRATIQEAGWTIGRFDGGPALGSPERGLVIEVSDIGGVDLQASVLQNALEKGGLSSVLRKDRSYPAGEIWLRVGVKP